MVWNQEQLNDEAIVYEEMLLSEMNKWNHQQLGNN